MVVEHRHQRWRHTTFLAAASRIREANRGFALEPSDDGDERCHVLGDDRSLPALRLLEVLVEQRLEAQEGATIRHDGSLPDTLPDVDEFRLEELPILLPEVSGDRAVLAVVGVAHSPPPA
jgi:hypothetical protein